MFALKEQKTTQRKFQLKLYLLSILGSLFEDFKSSSLL